MNTFNELIGNDQVKKHLRQMLKKGTVGNSLLFAGPEGVGKALFARAFALELLGTKNIRHPDLRIYRPMGKVGLHSIDTMRKFSEEVYLSPYQADHKVFIIEDADRMLTYSANALLKTFEEPSFDSVIILVSSRPESLLPTVLSRCRTVRFVPVPQLQAVGDDPIRASLLNFLALPYDYPTMLDFVKGIAADIESQQKVLEEEVRKELAEGFFEMTAAQKETFQKEVEGSLSLQLSQHAHSLFTSILFWYRDLHLLLAGGSSEYLFHESAASALESALQRGSIPPLEKVESIIASVRLAQSRSTSLPICLENLFLSLS